MENPLVSVIIPTYNREKYIKRAIDSVLSQTYQNFEIIIIDDGSTDNTKEFLQSYFGDKRICYIYQDNQGVATANNNGIKKASGKYIALLHSDDFWCDNRKIEKQINFLEKYHDYLLVGGGIIRVKENGKETFRILYPENDEQIRKTMLLSCSFASSAVVFKKEAWKKTKGFNENIEVCEDWDLWMKIGKVGKLYNFQEYFIHYQESEKSLSNFYRRKSFRYNLELIQKYSKDYPTFVKKAILLNICYYLYSFVPFNQKLLPIFSKIKRMIFGKPSYKDFNKPC